MENHFDICWVCFPLRDGFGSVHGELAQARHRFFTGGRRTVRVDSSQTVKGFEGRIRGRIARRSFYWKKSAKGASGGSVALEEAFGQKDGWVLVTRDLLGVIVSRAYFDKEQRWTRSEYYEPWSSGSPRVTFLPGPDSGSIERRDWEGEDFRSHLLYTAPYRSGTAAQSLVDTQFGQPQLVITTTKGELCCCPRTEAEARAKALESVSGGTMVLMPAWEVRDGELLDDSEGDGAAVTFTSLEEYAKIEPPRPETAPPAEEAKPADEEEPGEAPPPPAEEEEFSPEAVEEAEPSREPGDESAGEVQPEAPQAALQEKVEEGIAAPPRYVGSIREGKMTGRGRTEQQAGMTSYEGDYLDGKRHGFGTYYYKDGNLCYAGSWKDDRRDGLGVSFRDQDHALHVANWRDGQPEGLVTLFDKEGSLRYSGRIENGKKEGAGVMINGQDGTVFVGQWSGGEATGLGSAFDSEGRLLYYGGWKDGKKHGHGAEFDANGGVIFDGEFRDGKYYNGVLYQKLEAPDFTEN